MITRVWSDLKTFREVHFKAGMNIVLADRASDSDEKETTNGLGKTTLIRIIHFCLGAGLAHDKLLKHADLKGVNFGLDFISTGRTFSVQRNTATPDDILVSAEFIEGLEIDSKRIDDDLAIVDLATWKIILSLKYYPEARQGNGGTNFLPSFRDLSHYLMRFGKGAYMDPQLSFQGQSGPQKRLATSFLLGLNWSIQRDLHEDIATRKQLKQAIKVIQDLDTVGEHKSLGDLEADRVALETSLRIKSDEVKTFNVRDDYRELESSLNEVDRTIHDNINVNHSDSRLLDFYEQSASDLPENQENRPASLLEDAKSIFKEEALRDLDAVATFHAEIFRNRKNFLQGEIKRLRKAIGDRSELIDSLTGDKQALLQVLGSSGALEALIQLQREYTDLTAQHEVLKSQIDDRGRLDKKEDKIATNISHQKSLLKRDLEDRRETIDDVRGLFAEFTQELYGTPGGLSVDVGPAGYKFSFTLPRSGSDGVEQMIVFCFDLTIATLWAKRGKGFGTLIHDSTLFADVDPRQYAAALKLAHKKSEEYGFQYICCLNVGSIPFEDLGSFGIQPFIQLKLHDKGVEGRLLGKHVSLGEKI